MTSYPQYWYSVGYDTEVQHHRSQVCLYFWSFLQAIMWIYLDRVESHNAQLHWETSSPKVAGVVADYLLAAHCWPDWDAAHPHASAWARKLAAAYKLDGEGQERDWPPWVSAVYRAPLTTAETKAVKAQKNLGATAKRAAAKRAAAAAVAQAASSGARSRGAAAA
jgi:hypothetical protein